MSFKILIIGHHFAGKDTVAEMLCYRFGLKYESSSHAAARIFLYNKLKDKYNYKSIEECLADRVNHRAEWYNLICDYNKDDKARLAKEILLSNDIYVGMRSNDELQECYKQEIFDFVLGVFDPRKPLEDKSSNDIDIFAVSDAVIINNSTLEYLRNKISWFNFYK